MTLVDELKAGLPDLRGRLTADVVMADLTWLRVGGPAEVLFSPADADDLAYLIKNKPSDVPVSVIGLGSNTLVRDGGIKGIVVRLGRGFSNISVEENYQLRAGAAVPDVNLAKAAAKAGIDGLSFYRGIPGAIGGALRMNGGAYGTETKDILVEAQAVTPSGDIVTLSNVDMGYSYRHCSVDDDYIFTSALFQGFAGDREKIEADMLKITTAREETQPIKSRTSGSTFKNPEGHKAWQLIDAAGCRGLTIGDAQMSEKHCNFLINMSNATAADLETLGETVRQRVFDNSGVQLHWEVRRVGIA